MVEYTTMGLSPLQQPEDRRNMTWAWEEDTQFDDAWGDDAESRSDFADDGWSGEDGMLSHAVRFGEDLFGREDDDFGNDIFDGSDEGVQQFIDERAMSEYWTDEFDTDAEGLNHWDDEWADAPNRYEHRGLDYDPPLEWADQQDWDGADAASSWDKDNGAEIARTTFYAMDEFMTDDPPEPSQEENDKFVDEEIDQGLEEGWLSQDDFSDERWEQYEAGTGPKAEDVMYDIELDQTEPGDTTPEEDLIAMKEELLELELENAQTESERTDDSTTLPGDGEVRNAADEVDQTGEGADD